MLRTLALALSHPDETGTSHWPETLLTTATELPLTPELEELLRRFEPQTDGQSDSTLDGFLEIESAMDELSHSLGLTREQADLTYTLSLYRVWVENGPPIGAGAVISHPTEELLQQLAQLLSQGAQQCIQEYVPELSVDTENLARSLQLKLLRSCRPGPNLSIP